MALFKWTRRRETAALALAEGCTEKEAAERSGAGYRTVQRWHANPEFSAEVDRLSLMVGVASRAARLRIVQKVVHQKVREERVATEKDVLDWLKFAQSETDGAKLDLAAIFEAMEAATADRGQPAATPADGDAAVPDVHPPG